MTNGEAHGPRRVPIAAAVLGGAGLLPPLVAIFARLQAGAGTPVGLAAVLLGLTYAALILSFLGGLWWGIGAARLGPSAIGRLLGLSVLPSLVAFAILGLSRVFPGPCAVALAVAILLTLPVDRGLAARGLAPRWWMRLRVPLSGGLAALTLVLAGLI